MAEAAGQAVRAAVAEAAGQAIRAAVVEAAGQAIRTVVAVVVAGPETRAAVEAAHLEIKASAAVAAAVDGLAATRIEATEAVALAVEEVSGRVGRAAAGGSEEDIDSNDR